MYINIHSGASQTSTALLSTFLTVTNGAASFSFIAPEAGTISVDAEVYNNVSSITTKQTLMVAGKRRGGRERERGGNFKSFLCF